MTFVVFTSSEKYGILSPDIVGPFTDEVTAQAFIDLACTYGRDEPLDGGYVGIVLVGAGSAEDPAQYAKDREWETA